MWCVGQVGGDAVEGGSLLLDAERATKWANKLHNLRRKGRFIVDRGLSNSSIVVLRPSCLALWYISAFVVQILI